MIGGREKPKIVIAEYDPRWPACFDRERGRVRGALGFGACRIEHVGSTAVPDLAAKPIIDVLVTVEDPDADGAIVPVMESAGYELRVRLRRSDNDRRAYERLKLELATREWSDMNEYAHANGALIESILSRAGTSSK